MTKKVRPVAGGAATGRENTTEQICTELPKQTTASALEQDNRPILDYVRAVDHKFFNAHPGTDVYLREFIVGEFHESRLPCRVPPPGYRFVVQVQAFRDPVDHTVIMRIRSFMVLPHETPLQWYASSTVQSHGGSA